MVAPKDKITDVDKFISIALNMLSNFNLRAVLNLLQVKKVTVTRHGKCTLEKEPDQSFVHGNSVSAPDSAAS